MASGHSPLCASNGSTGSHAIPRKDGRHAFACALGHRRNCIRAEARAVGVGSVPPFERTSHPSSGPCLLVTAGAERGRGSEAASSRSEVAKSQLLRRQPEALAGSPVPV